MKYTFLIHVCYLETNDMKLPMLIVLPSLFMILNNTDVFEYDQLKADYRGIEKDVK